jgi:hypothetical protein
MNHEPDSEAVTAAIADVEPLDELTKARLVRTAMATSAPHRSTRWLGVAAAIVAVVLVAGGAVAVLTRDIGGRQVAEPAVAPTDSDRGASTASPKALSSSGDLGSVDSEAELRDALEGFATTRATSSADASGASKFASDPPGLAPTCPSPEPFPPPATAWATVVYQGKPALVALATDDDVQYAFVLSPNGCTLIARVEL